MVLYRLFIIGLGLLALAILPATAAKRVALVIGNGAYQEAGTLNNPVNDAADMAKALTQLGFDAVLGLDLDRRAFDEKLRAFSRALDEADAAVLFYAGHGLQVAGRNYLVPVDARLKSERDLDFEAIGVDFVLRQMESGREGKTNIIFLDACRDNPLARNLARSMGTRSASVGHGLAEVHTGVGTFIAYSTQPGNVALDGAGRNSPFAAALSKRVLEPRNLNALMIEVRNDVLKTTGGRQVPWDHSALTSDFFFNPEAQAANSEAGSESGRDLIQARLRAIEAQINSKSDRKQTLSLVKLEQLKERVRQIDKALEEDRKRDFDLFVRYSRRRDRNDPDASRDYSDEKMAILSQMGQREREKETLLKEIKKLNAELGMTEAEAK
jgi:uncharacterized caspase-like protein